MAASLKTVLIVIITVAAVGAVDDVGTRYQTIQDEFQNSVPSSREWLTGEEEEDVGEGRFLFTSTTTVTTNSTLLRAIGALVGLLLLTLPLYLAYATALGDGGGGYAYGYGNRRRQKRDAHSRDDEESFASYYLYLLLDSFRRHHLEDEDLDCQLWSACLAGSGRDDGLVLFRQDKQGLEVELFRILRSANANVDDPDFMSSAPSSLLRMMEVFRRGFEGGGCKHLRRPHCRFPQKPP